MRRIGLAAGLLCVASAASALTYTVTSTADSGAGSLRQAITDANTNPGADTIAVQHRGLGRPDDHPGDAASADHRGRDDRRLHAAGGVGQHESGRARVSTRCSASRSPEPRRPGHRVSTSGRSNVTIRGLAINRFSQYQIDGNSSFNHSNLVVEGCFIGVEPRRTLGYSSRRRDGG